MALPDTPYTNISTAVKYTARTKGVTSYYRRLDTKMTAQNGRSVANGSTLSGGIVLHLMCLTTNTETQ